MRLPPANDPQKGHGIVLRRHRSIAYTEHADDVPMPLHLVNHEDIAGGYDNDAVRARRATLMS